MTTIFILAITYISIYQTSEERFSRALIGSPRIFLVRMTAHGSENMASRFLESLSEAQISEIHEKATPINKKKAT